METINYCIGLCALIAFIGIIGGILYIYLDHAWRPKKPKFRLNTHIDKGGTHYRAEFHRPIIGWRGFNAYLCTGQIIRDNTWYTKPVACNKSIKAYSQIVEGTYEAAFCPGQN